MKEFSIFFFFTPGNEVTDAKMKSADLEDALADFNSAEIKDAMADLSLIHISEPTRRTPISYAVFCLMTSLPLLETISAQFHCHYVLLLA